MGYSCEGRERKGAGNYYCKLLFIVSYAVFWYQELNNHHLFSWIKIWDTLCSVYSQNISLWAVKIPISWSPWRSTEAVASVSSSIGGAADAPPSTPWVGKERGVREEENCGRKCQTREWQSLAHHWVREATFVVPSQASEGLEPILVHMLVANLSLIQKRLTAFRCHTKSQFSVSMIPRLTYSALSFMYMGKKFAIFTLVLYKPGFVIAPGRALTIIWKQTTILIQYSGFIYKLWLE